MAAINKNFPFMEIPLSISRQGAFPVDRFTLWWEKSKADEYAKSNPTAYVGMPISVYDETESTVTFYVINANKELQEVGTKAKVDNKSVAYNADGETIELKNFSSVSKAGLTIKTKAVGDGTFTIEWVEPLDVTVEALETKVTQIEKTLATKADASHSHALKDLTADATHRTVTDTEKAGWSAKATPAQVDEKIAAIPEATSAKSGLMPAKTVTAIEQMATDISTAEAEIEKFKKGQGITYPVASKTVKGIMQVGENLTVSEAGVVSAPTPYSHPSTHPASIIVQDAAHRFVTDVEKAGYADKYTKNEVDNKIATLTAGMEWKPAVDTYAKIAETYPTPKDGWTVNVKDTDITYRYTGTAWIEISANAIPVATASVDGKMSKEDKNKLDGIAVGANNYVHPESHPASMITEDATHRFTTDADKATAKQAAADATAAKAKSTENGTKIQTLEQKVSALETGITYMTSEEALAIVNKYRA